MPDAVDFYASERQYADHLLPIWHALGEEERGSFFYQGDVERHLHNAGVAGWSLERGRPRGAARLTVVAAYSDMVSCRQRPIVLVNHGVGQTYRGDSRAALHPAYSGGTQRENVVLFLCPSERDAAANRKAYPDVRHEVVGCPKLDTWWEKRPENIPENIPPVVAVSWHFPLRLCPETMWAFPEYHEAVVELAKTHHVIGHAHPRAWERLRPWYDEHLIEPVEHFADVLDRADVYVCDNSSTIYEFASTDRPVVLLNASWYRRNVEHGLRFWEFADVGVQVDRPEDLAAAVDLAIEDPADGAAIRQQITATLYGHRDGRCAERAAEAIRVVAAETVVRSRRAVTHPFGASRRKYREPQGAELPLPRLLRAGASTEQALAAQTAWDAMSPEERVAQTAKLAAMSDEELAEMLRQDRGDREAVLGVVRVDD